MLPVEIYVSDIFIPVVRVKKERIFLYKFYIQSSLHFYLLFDHWFKNHNSCCARLDYQHKSRMRLSPGYLMFGEKYCQLIIFCTLSSDT